MNNKKLFTKALSISLTAAMVLTMAPISPLAKNTAKVKSIKAPKSSMIKVGQTKTIVATRKSKKSTADVKYVKFSPAKTKNIGISVKTSDDAVVSVEKISDGKYTYTGVNTGTATLTIKTREANAKGKKLTAKLNVSVINPFAVKQTGAYTFTMSTADKLEKVDKRDIKVTQEGSIVDNAVKEVKIAEDKMSVEVTMEVPFVDQKKYEVTFGKEKGSFVASVGAPVAINVKTQQVVQNKPTEVEYSIVDAKGIDVTGVLDKAKITVEVKAKTGHYDASSKKLTLWKVGDTAEATVTYHSWVYDQKTGKENVIEGKATITCVDKSSVTVTGLDKWTIADRVLSWATDDMKTTIAQNKKAKIWVRMKKSDGTYVDNKDNAADFTFEPINTATLYVYSNGEVFATREGMEYVKVTYFDGTVKYQYTLPVTVGKKAEATSLVLSNPYVIISKDASVGTLTTFKVLDQYGEAMDSVGMPAVEKISGVDVATFTSAGKNAGKDIQKINVNANGTVGTGVYKLTYDNLSISMTVQAQNVSAATSGYMLKADVTEIDTTIHRDTETAVIDELATGVKLNFAETKAGLIDKDANAAFKTAEIKINGNKVDPDKHPMLDRNTDGSLVFKTVLKDGDNYVLLGNKSAGYTIEAVAKIGDKNVTVSTFINVKNDTQLPKKDESYEVSKISAEDNMYYAGVISQAIVDKTDKVANRLSKEAVAKTGRVLALNGNKPVAAPDNGDNVDALKASQVYIDTAALPSFRLNDKKTAIWVVTDKLNQEVKNKDENLEIADFKNMDNPDTPKSAEYFQVVTFQGSVNAVSVKDRTGVLSLEKIYLKSDPDMQDKIDWFDDVTTRITGTVKDNNAVLKIKTSGGGGRTPAGEYVAVIKYRTADKEYTQTVEFEITRRVIRSLELFVNNTHNGARNHAPEPGEPANDVHTSTISGIEGVFDGAGRVEAKNVSYYTVKDGTKIPVEPTYIWQAGDTPLYVIELDQGKNHRFESPIRPILNEVGKWIANDSGYFVVHEELDKNGHLIVHIQRNAPLQ